MGTIKSSGTSRFTLFHFLSAATFLLLLFMVQPFFAQGRTGDVYVLTNQTSGNSVMVFHRDARGVLTFSSSFPTGGVGAGVAPDPLESQGPVILSRDNRLLFAVNAGSNSIAVFAVSGDSLTLLQTVSSGGTMPVSLTVMDNLLYVLNAGGTPNISGFTIESATNHLVPLPGSTQNLPGGAGSAPAQVSFRSQGNVLVVTEKGTNSIDTFTLNDAGVAQPGVSFPSASAGTTAFGFAFGHRNIAIVSDAAANSALSSYEVHENGDLDVVTIAEYDNQVAACWVVVTRNGKFAYTSNTGSNTISSFTISEGGYLQLLNQSAGIGNVPVDMDLSHNSRFLYVRNAGNHSVSGFRVGADGGLAPVNTVWGLPDVAAGVAAR